MMANLDQNITRNEFNSIKVLPSIKTLIDHLPDFPRVKNDNKYIKNNNITDNDNNIELEITLHSTETFPVAAGADEEQFEDHHHQKQQFTHNRVQHQHHVESSSSNKLTTFLPHPPLPQISNTKQVPGRLPSRNTTPVVAVVERLRTRILTSAKVEHNNCSNHQDYIQGSPGSFGDSSVQQSHQRPQPLSLMKNNILSPISNDGNHNKSQFTNLSFNSPKQLAKKLATMKGILKPAKVDKDVLRFCDPLVKPRGAKNNRITGNDTNEITNINNSTINQRLQIQPTIVTGNGPTPKRHHPQHKHAQRRDFAGGSAVQRQLAKLYGNNDTNTNNVSNRPSTHHLPPLLDNNNKHFVTTTLAPSAKSRIAKKREESLMKNQNKNSKIDQQHQRTDLTLPKRLQPLPTVASSKTHDNTPRLSHYSASRSRHNQRPPSAGHRRFGALDMGFQNNVTYFHNPKNFQ